MYIVMYCVKNHSQLQCSINQTVIMPMQKHSDLFPKLCHPHH